MASPAMQPCYKARLMRARALALFLCTFALLLLVSGVARAQNAADAGAPHPQTQTGNQTGTRPALVPDTAATSSILPSTSSGASQSAATMPTPQVKHDDT